MNFRSDNVAGLAPEILAAIARANAGPANAYGNDAITERLDAAFAGLFEREVAVFPVATGTAANVLCLAAACPPWGLVYCHPDSHVLNDEANAPEFYTGGARLCALPGPHGKFTAAALKSALDQAPEAVHHAKPSAVTITNLSEAGTAYTVAETRAIADAAHGKGLALHLDGARFANALAALGATPAEATWRAGVDLMSFGATKNGALAAEAAVVFKPELAATIAYRRKRGGHLFSKMRFLSAQLEAYLAGDLWLRNARHANAQARRIAEGFAALPGAHLVHPVEGNEIFAEMPKALADALARDGFELQAWAGTPERPILRMVAAFDTAPADVDRLLASARKRQAA